jgi:hypothetical protein
MVASGADRGNCGRSCGCTGGYVSGERRDLLLPEIGPSIPRRVLDRASTRTVLNMAESPDAFLVVCGVGIGAAALPTITVATFSLIRQRRPVRNPSTWEIPREVAGGLLPLALAQLLVSVTILADELGSVRGLVWGALLASWALGVVGCYRIIRFRRSRLNERHRENRLIGGDGE